MAYGACMHVQNSWTNSRGGPDCRDDRFSTTNHKLGDQTSSEQWQAFIYFYSSHKNETLHQEVFLGNENSENSQTAKAAGLIHRRMQ
jgi:hypothetical protein